jgi:hypothetical protein
MKLESVWVKQGEREVIINDVELLKDGPEAWAGLAEWAARCLIDGRPPGTVLEVPMAYGRWPEDRHG